MSGQLDQESEFFLEALVAMSKEKFRKDSLCSGMPGDLFIEPDKPHATGPHLTDLGREVCAGCPVGIQCLDSSLRYRDQGIRFGLDDAQRNQIMRHRQKYATMFAHDIRRALGNVPQEPAEVRELNFQGWTPPLREGLQAVRVA